MVDTIWWTWKGVNKVQNTLGKVKKSIDAQEVEKIQDLLRNSEKNRVNIKTDMESRIFVISVPTSKKSKVWQKIFPIKGMLYPCGNSELMCHKLPTIPREIFWKFGLNFVPLIILSCNRISTLKIDSLYNHTKFHKVQLNTGAVISILQITWL